MSYSQVLKKAIEESKLSHIQISEKCEALGEAIVPSYISKLANGEMNPPKDKKSKVLAQVLGIDSNKLILEAYLDKAPKDIIDFLNYARFSMVSLLSMTYDNSLTNDIFEKVKQSLDEMSLSDFLIQMNNLQQNTMSLANGSLTANFDFENDNYDLTVNESVGFPVKDDSMFPLIAKDSLVKLEIKEKYNDGDVLCFVNKNEPQNFFYRKCFFKDDLILAHPLNSGYESLSVKMSDIAILGKVKRVIKDI